MWEWHLAAISLPENLINACLKRLFTIKDPPFIEYARVAELVDARDLKSLGVNLCTSSILVPGTSKEPMSVKWLK